MKVEKNYILKAIKVFQVFIEKKVLDHYKATSRLKFGFIFETKTF